MAGGWVGRYSLAPQLSAYPAPLRGRARQGLEKNLRLARLGSQTHDGTAQTEADSSLAAARSRNQISFPSWGRTSFEGYCSPGALPSRTSRKTVALSAPLTKKVTS